MSGESGMEKILVFKTSTDATIKKLFADLGKKDVDCLIQKSQFDRYRKEYPYINFIDICQEGFYDLPARVIDMISSRIYDQVYITFSDREGYSYGNVLELLEQINYKNAFFYNCNGDRMEIPRGNMIKDILCRIYIEFTGFIYDMKERLAGCAE